MRTMKGYLTILRESGKASGWLRAHHERLSHYIEGERQGEWVVACAPVAMDEKYCSSFGVTCPYIQVTPESRQSHPRFTSESRPSHVRVTSESRPTQVEPRLACRVSRRKGTEGAHENSDSSRSRVSVCARASVCESTSSGESVAIRGPRYCVCVSLC